MAYVENNPEADFTSSWGNSSNESDDPEDLTKDGKGFCRSPRQCYDGEGMKELFNYYLSTSGWWNEYGAGTFTLEMFLGMMLMYELNQGVGGEAYLIKAAILQIWGDASDVEGHGPYCSSVCVNGVFNFLAAYVQSAQKRYDLLIKHIDPVSGDPKEDYDPNLDAPCCWPGPGPYSQDAYSIYFSKRAANIGFQVLNPDPEDTIYAQDKPYHWGNYTKVGDIKPFFSFGNFHIFSTEAHNSATEAGGTLVQVR